MNQGYLWVYSLLVRVLQVVNMSISLFQVVLMALVLLVATFAIGYLPLYWSIRNAGADGTTIVDDEKRDQMVTVFSQFGVGMLLGTCLMLVIPEGIVECLEHGGNVGLNLLTGFLVVYVLDRVVQSITKNRGEINERPEGVGKADIAFESLKDLIRNPKQVLLAIFRNNVVFALFVHGLSDGIALGTTVNNDSLLIVMLIAIVIHKIPAVLSLTSLMISKQNLPKWEVISNLFAFSASTPIGYIVLSMFNLKHSETMSWLSGNLLLMSGGSLLYASFTAFVSGSEGGNHGHNHFQDDDFVRDISVDSTKLTEPTELDIEWDPRRYNLVDNDELNDPVLNTSMASNANIIVPPTRTFLKSFDWLSMDDSVYTLAGVLIPVVISFIISEE